MDILNIPQTLMIVCPLVFLGGLIDAVAGGGGLNTLPAYLLAGLPPHLASGTNKVVNSMGTALATSFSQPKNFATSYMAAFLLSFLV